MEQASEHPFPGLKDHYRVAAGLGFPAFIGSIDDSTPINATPYVVGLEDFLSESLPAPKRALRDALSAALKQLPEIGLQAEIVLIGGSFLQLDATPRDLDCVVFYSRPGEIAGDLAGWQARQHAHGLDLRLIPIEMDPVMVLKTALFFGALYGIGRGESKALRGLLLVDCSK